MKRPAKRGSPRRDHYLVFDIETNRFPEGLAKAKRLAAIRKLKTKCAWAYCSKTNRYIYFSPGKISKLVALIHQADIVVGFNHLSFDCEVLKQHGLKCTGMAKKSIDLFALIKEETGNWYSLDKLSKQNFGMGKISNKNLSAYCKHDVLLTHKLYKRWKLSKLEYDNFRWRRNYEVIDDAYVASELFAPETCPDCGSGNLEINDDDFATLTEGQMADRLAGFGGSSYCVDCGSVLEHG